MTKNLDQISDEKLRDAILAGLAGDNRTTNANLRVGVSNGIAHIAGVVALLEIFIAATKIAEAVPGVRGVVNRIEAPGAPSPARMVNLNLEKGNTND